MDKLNVSVLGTGNGGTAMAAHVKAQGHYVKLIKTSTTIHNEHFKTVMENHGQLSMIEGDKTKTVHLDLVTTNIAEITESDVIVIFIRTRYHEKLIKRMAPYLRDNHIILLEPGYLSTAFFMKYVPDLRLNIVEAESSPMDCRIVSPGKVEVYFRNKTNPLGVFPGDSKSFVKRMLDALNLKFAYDLSVFEAALHNPNLIVHTIGAFMSIPRIEQTDNNYSMYKEVFTPTVWKLVEGLDREKMAILDALGYLSPPYVETCKRRNTDDLNRDAKEVFDDYANHHSVDGPNIADSRYITEDVPEGLVLLEDLGKHLNIKTPVCSSFINLANIAMNMDYREIGRTIDRLGEANLRMISKDDGMNLF